MSENTVIEWLAENSYRSYPLALGGSPEIQIKGTSYNIIEMLVDANIVSSSSGIVGLTALTVNNTVATFTITGGINFNVALDGAFPAYIYNGRSLLVFGANTAALLGQMATFRFTDLIFEPSVVTVIPGNLAGLSSLHVNGDDTGTEPAFYDGIQFSLIPSRQTIQIEAGVNNGLPLPCGNYRSTNEERDCSTTVSSVAGAGPVNSGDPVVIKAGAHVKVFDDPDNHRVYIGLDFVPEDIGSNKLLLP